MFYGNQSIFLKPHHVNNFSCFKSLCFAKVRFSPTSYFWLYLYVYHLNLCKMPHKCMSLNNIWFSGNHAKLGKTFHFLNSLSLSVYEINGYM